MALSEREQKLLEQMERALYAEDPQFANNLQRGRRTAKATAAGVALALTGVGLLFVGLSTSSSAIGIAAFALMVGGLSLVFLRKSAPGAAPASAGGTRVATPRRSFMDRLNDRWDGRAPR